MYKGGLYGKLLPLFSFLAGPLRAEQRVTMRSIYSNCNRL